MRRRRDAPERRPQRPIERHPNEPHRLGRLRHDELRLQPQHTIAAPRERTIPPRIERPPPNVIGAIHFHHERHRHGDEVADETTERHLPPKPDAKLPAAKLEP